MKIHKSTLLILKGRCVATLFAMLFPLIAFADYSNTGIQIDCLQSKGEILFNIETIMNEPAMWAAAPEGDRERFLSKARARNLFLEGAFDFKCKLGSNEIRIWGEMFEPSSQGECGANPGGKLHLSVDGLSVLNFLNIGNACFPSVWRGAFRINSGVSGSPAQFELCGHDRFGVFSGKEPKCVSRPVPLTQPFNKKQRPLFNQDDLEKMVGDS